jgi:UDP-N-acetylmuramoyl-L-alanyl-D-glutamate--2,6-diaminopimelate ligase
MEVSSHALDQRRTDGLNWAAAVFTNLTPEHLDYHRTMERYARAKQRLFEALPPEAVAVLNGEDPVSKRFAQAAPGRSVTYGFGLEDDFKAQNIRFSLEGTVFDCVTDEGTYKVNSPLIGRYNVENLLAALAAVNGLGIPVAQAIEGIPFFEGVPGRLERIEAGQPFPVFVDYAHTDDALSRLLKQLRVSVENSGKRVKLLTLFGCGGDRDRSKRPRMGAAAAKFSDRVIVTSDNPRSEDPAVIAQEILKGIHTSTTPVEVILDRREAIQAALEQVDDQWLVVIAGKGHEAGQVMAGHEVPFSDAAVVWEILTTSETISQ